MIILIITQLHKKFHLIIKQTAAKNKYWKSLLFSQSILLWIFLHNKRLIWNRYPHLKAIRTPLPKKMWIFTFFHLPFHHHLLYNDLVIQDIRLCISICRIHLHPLLGVFENFPVAMKMYFLCFARSLSSMG